ncbi:hypothetical protein ILUMI_27211, partial [Ignelater luminosus]
MDKTGLSAVVDKSPKILTTKGKKLVVLASHPGCSTDVSVQDLYAKVNYASLHVAPPPLGCTTNNIDVLDLDIVCED